MSNAIIAAMDTYYAKDADYKRTVINSFSSGSVAVDLTIVFKPLALNEDQINQQKTGWTKPANSSAPSIKVGNYVVDKSTVNVEIKQDGYWSDWVNIGKKCY